LLKFNQFYPTSFLLGDAAAASLTYATANVETKASSNCCLA